MDAIEIGPSDNSEHVEHGIVSTVEICRLCLLDNLAMRDLFHENGVESLSTKAMSFASVKMSPDDGLPGQVCCMCVEKLESAYEFKLQVEHADTVLRERFLTMNMKEELFFNEVEVHLESDRHEHTDDMSMDAMHYQAVTASLTAAASEHVCCAMKDTGIGLLPIDKVDQLEQRVAEQESEPTSSTKIESVSHAEGLNFLQSNSKEKVQEDVDMSMMMAETIEERPGLIAPVSINVSFKHENQPETMGPDEHDYILHNSSLMSGGTEVTITESDSHLVTVNSEEAHANNDELLVEPLLRDKEKAAESNEESAEFHLPELNNSQDESERELAPGNELPHEKEEEEDDEEEEAGETSQVQPMRRSKRNLSRKSGNEDNETIEETYFENLNLSSRLKKAQVEQAGNSEKVFFACYLCDKQFLTKDLLKEHLHSHEEVRKTLLFKKAPEKGQKSVGESPQNMPPSGRKANRCPYCGKEYLYIISFNKHLKQHEREKEEDGGKGGGGGSAMPVEVSLEEDEQSFDIGDDYSSRRKSIVEGRKRRRRYQSPSDDGNETKVEMEEMEMTRGGDQEGEIEKKLCRDEDEKQEGVSNDTRANEESDNRPDGGKQWRRRCRVSEFQCDRCSDTFSNKRDFRKHLAAHLRLKCSVCAEEFDSLEKLRNHRTKHVLEGVLSEQDLEESAKLNKSDAHVQQTKREDEEGASSASPNPMVASDDNEESYYDDNFNTNTGVDGAFVASRKGESRSGSHYNCKLCEERFARRDLLQRHMDQQHPQVKAYKCTECNKTFGNELTLRNHLIATNHKTFVHGQEYDPNKRIKRVAARAAQRIIDKIKTEDGLEDLEEDEDNEGGGASGQPCDLERSMCGRRRDATAQRRTYAKKELECANCSKRCSSKQALSKHMELHTKEEKMEKLEKCKKFNVDRKDGGVQKYPRNPVISASKDSSIERERTITGPQVRIAAAGGNGAGSCGGGGGSGSGCSSTTGGITGTAGDADDDDSDFESGLDWPMDNHECATCKKRYSTKKSLLRHQLLHEEPNFECDICNVKFYRKDKLKAHYDKCSEKNPDQVRKCNICGDSFENNEMLREHRAKHVTEGILTEEDLRDIEPRPEEKRQGERIGRKRRTDIVGLECTECNKQYTSRKGLLRHIQVHEGKKYLCDICPKKFYRREHLKIHVAKHNMIKPYKCNRCTKRFIKEEQLTNHLSKHDRTFKKNKETDSTKRFLCEICSKSFTQSTTLIAHLRAHNGIKPYVCEVCSRPFTTNAYLKMHMRTHTQERPYICQYCSRAFARADTLANHLTSHTGEAKYHCKYCPKNFRRLKSLKEHVFIHTGQRPYACPTCDRRFNNNGSRYAHSKRCKQNFAQNQNRAQSIASAPLQTINQHQNQNQQRLQQATIATSQIVKAQNIKTIAITRQPDPIATQQVMQHQEILMPLIFEILPEGTKIFTTT